MFTNRDLRKLIIPLLFEQLLTMVVGLADTIMISSAGEAAISGVSIVNDVNLLLIALVTALAGGGSVCVSQFLGNGDKKRTNLSASQLITISFIFSFLMGFLGFIFCNRILALLYSTVEFDVMNSAIIYFKITAISFPFLGLYSSACALYRCMAKTKVTLDVSIVMNVINIVGNYFCIYILHMGVAGVAIPTLISRIVGAYIMCKLCFDENNQVSINYTDIFKIDKEIVNKILNIAIPNSLENGLFNIGKILISTIVASYGTSAIAANGVVGSIIIFCYATDSSMSLSMVTVIGQTVGSGDYDATKYYIKKMLFIGIAMCLGSNLLTYLAAPLFMKFYILSSETAMLALKIIGWTCLASGTLHTVSFVLPSALRATGDAKYTMYVGIFSMFAFRCLGAYILGTCLGYGLEGTYIAMFIDWAVRIVFFVNRYNTGKWMEYRII